mmetsp:Transcript_104083/g.324502  ORF Transcript_104083/g.324502 Transcript_104083/m.324502 type:complete len:211 (+) Transcript_104083:402-1034(+)
MLPAAAGRVPLPLGLSDVRLARALDAPPRGVQHRRPRALQRLRWQGRRRRGAGGGRGGARGVPRDDAVPQGGGRRADLGLGAGSRAGVPRQPGALAHGHSLRRVAGEAVLRHLQQGERRVFARVPRCIPFPARVGRSGGPRGAQAQGEAARGRGAGLPREPAVRRGLQDHLGQGGEAPRRRFRRQCSGPGSGAVVRRTVLPPGEAQRPVH